MLILTIRTDKPEAELGLFNDEKELGYEKWQAHRELSKTIHIKLRQMLEAKQLNLRDLDAILFYKGPGSFTGLRIGVSVANALSYSLKLPIVSTTGINWIKQGITKLERGANEKIVLPEYGALPHITKPKK